MKLFALIAILLLSLYLSLSPGLSLPGGRDKFAHVAFYALVSFALMKLFGWKSFPISISIAALMEILQMFSRSRTASFSDFLASCAGVTITLLWRCLDEDPCREAREHRVQHKATLAGKDRPSTR